MAKKTTRSKSKPPAGSSRPLSNGTSHHVPNPDDDQTDEEFERRVRKQAYARLGRQPAATPAPIPYKRPCTERVWQDRAQEEQINGEEYVVRTDRASYSSVPTGPRAASSRQPARGDRGDVKQESSHQLAQAISNPSQQSPVNGTTNRTTNSDEKSVAQSLGQNIRGEPVDKYQLSMSCAHLRRHLSQWGIEQGQAAEIAAKFQSIDQRRRLSELATVLTDLSSLVRFLEDLAFGIKEEHVRNMVLAWRAGLTADLAPYTPWSEDMQRHGSHRSADTLPPPQHSRVDANANPGSCPRVPAAQPALGHDSSHGAPAGSRALAGSSKGKSGEGARRRDSACGMSDTGSATTRPRSGTWKASGRSDPRSSVMQGNSITPSIESPKDAKPAAQMGATTGSSLARLRGKSRQRSRSVAAALSSPKDAMQPIKVTVPRNEDSRNVVFVVNTPDCPVNDIKIQDFRQSCTGSFQDNTWPGLCERWTEHLLRITFKTVKLAQDAVRDRAMIYLANTMMSPELIPVTGTKCFCATVPSGAILEDEIKKRLLGAFPNMVRKIARYSQSRCIVELREHQRLLRFYVPMEETSKGKIFVARFDAMKWNALCAHCGYMHSGVCNRADVLFQAPVRPATPAARQGHNASARVGHSRIH